MAGGRVLRIERASNHDGAGIRTVIFLKGCPLRCIWCSTPESQSGRCEIGVERPKCDLCGGCLAVCARRALGMDPRRGVLCDSAKCVGCGVCVKACPQRAIRVYGYEATSEEIVREIMKDLVFYQGTGGFTFSGGEPLAQPEFVLDVFRRCAVQGVRGTVETCLFVPWENIEPLTPYLDTMFVDLKHMSPEVHERITGVDNALVLENLSRLDSGRGPRLIVRVPLVPGMNDTEENFSLLAQRCRLMKRLDFVEILPYHRLGIETYRRLGLPEPLPSALPPGDADVAVWGRKLAKEGRVDVKVGSTFILRTTGV